MVENVEPADEIRDGGWAGERCLNMEVFRNTEATNESKFLRCTVYLSPLEVRNY